MASTRNAGHPQRRATFPVVFRQDARIAQGPPPLTTPLTANTSRERSKHPSSSDCPTEAHHTSSSASVSMKQPPAHRGTTTSPVPPSDVAATYSSPLPAPKGTQTHSVTASSSKSPTTEAKPEHHDDTDIAAPHRSDTFDSLEEYMYPAFP